MTHMISRSVFVLLLFSLSAFGQSDAPPADVVPYAGLSPQDAAEKATLPPGFRMHVFASEPDIVQPIAFCLDHRGRVWVAEGLTYPKRRGHPPAEPRPSRAQRSEANPSSGNPRPQASSAAAAGGTPGVQPTPEQLKDIFGG